MDSTMTLSWEVGWSDQENERPRTYVPAVVPGAVQLDWARAEQWGDHTYGENWRQYEWMEDKYWTYRATISPPELKAGERLFFLSNGIDYQFVIRMNGKELLRQEGMFTPVELELTYELKNDNVLEVVVFPAPKRADAAKGRDQADRSCKPAVSYGWDWHPRLIPLGIWDETLLVVRPAVYLSSAETTYQLSEQLDRVELKLQAEWNEAADGDIEWKLLSPAGEVVLVESMRVAGSAAELTAQLNQPELWWPHNHGEQPLYTSVVTFRPVQGGERLQGARLEEQHALVQVHQQKIGFRRVRLVMYEGGWKEPSTFPKSRSAPPITMEINGRTIFCKGTNWVNPRIFPGQITRDDYRVLLQLAKDANMNMLRIWGGGIVNKTSFHELCDELGIMVWQEFPLACNQYPDSAEYLQVLDQESRSIIKRLRKHPSLVLWCGGNELFNAWSRMTDQSWPLRLLGANCFELDPATPFLMTSPLDGMGHGHYMFQYRNGEDVLQSMPKASNTAYTEFGVPSPASVEQLMSFIPPEELYPPRPGTAWESHHAFHALSDNMWLMADQIEYFFGPWETLEQLVEYGQLLQVEGYKCIYEEARRQQPKCSMALNWCYNEPWPTAANNSIISWPAKPKPAYYAVKDSCRPILASARIPKYLWQQGEWFESELWLLNDSVEPIEKGSIEAYIAFEHGERHHLITWEYDAIAQATNLRGPTARFLLPDIPHNRFKLELVVKHHSKWNTSYLLAFKGEEQRLQPQRAALNFST